MECTKDSAGAVYRVSDMVQCIKPPPWLLRLLLLLLGASREVPVCVVGLGGDPEGGVAVEGAAGGWWRRSALQLGGEARGRRASGMAVAGGCRRVA